MDPITIIAAVVFYFIFMYGGSAVKALTSKKNKAKELPNPHEDDHKTKELEIENFGYDWWVAIGTRCECAACKPENGWIEYEKIRDTLDLQGKRDYLYKNVLSVDYDGYVLSIPSFASAEWTELEAEHQQIEAENNAKRLAILAKQEKEREQEMLDEWYKKTHTVYSRGYGVEFRWPPEAPTNAHYSIHADNSYGYAKVLFRWLDPVSGKTKGATAMGIVVDNRNNGRITAGYINTGRDPFHEPIQIETGDGRTYPIPPKGPGAASYIRRDSGIQIKSPLTRNFRCQECGKYTLDGGGRGGLCYSCRTYY